MQILVDTNILLRAVQRQHTDSPVAVSALKTLHRQSHQLCLTPQNLIEFWSVCTRPAPVNGLGYSAAVAARHVSRFESIFRMLPDSQQIFQEWKSLVSQHNVTGASVHDARLVAAMKLHAVDQVLTFDASGFTRYPGITVIQPKAV